MSVSLFLIWILTLTAVNLFLVSVPVASSYAMIVNDPINTAVNELQNAILQAEWAKDIALAIERLNELKSQTLEMLRFHSGFDEIWNSIIGEPFRNLIGEGSASLQNAFADLGLLTPQIEILQGSSGPQDIRAALEDITGEIPQTDARPYLVFDEIQVVDAFDLAHQIREAGVVTRDAANQIAEQAQVVSSKGAARLEAQAMSELMVLSQQNQEAMAKLLELEATQIEQVTREEKRIERERVKFMEDANDYADGIIQLFKGA